MLERAEAANARLRAAFPQGFTLDATHRPHITVLQRFVRTADLDQVYAAAGNILTGTRAAAWKLKAYKYYYIPSGEIGVAGIVIAPTERLLALQQALLEAVAPFIVDIGNMEAFATTPEEPNLVPGLIEYVSAFVPNATGANFNPHVSIGVADREYLDGMLAEPFEEFTFSPVGAAVYQLGDFGTARRRLKSWELKA